MIIILIAAVHTQLYLYFQSRCEDTKNFFTGSFKKAFAAGLLDAQVTYVVSGKSQFSKGKIQCHHGAQQCQQNAGLSCAISKLANNQDGLAKVIICYFQLFKGLEGLQQCFGRNKLAYQQVAFCINNYSQILLKHNLALTKEVIQLDYIPWAVWPKKFSQRAPDDLRTAICQARKILQDSRCT